MPSRARVLDAYERTKDYAQVGKQMGIPPGQAFMIATGLPADGGDTFPPAELDQPGTRPSLDRGTGRP